LQIGGGTATGVSWDEAVINWKNAKVTTTVSLGGTQLATLEMPLTAVPYALYANYAEEINPDAVVVTEIYNKMFADSNALAGQITNLDSKLTNRINVISDSVKTNYENIALNRQAIIDSTAHIRTEIDTTSKAIRNTLTTTASAIRSEVDTKLQSYAQLNGNNTFSGNNTFTGTVTAGTVNASSVTVTCGENVTADVCDLLQRINTLEQKINDPQTLLNLVGQMNDEQKRTLKNALGIYVADSVTLNKHTTTITTGGSEVLVAKVWPSEAAQEVQWSSSNPSVATVNDGVVHAVTTGQTIITAKSMSEPSYYATCTVTVSSPQPNALFNLKRNDDGTWEVTMPTNDLEGVEFEVYNE
jgi:DNA replication protein DnaD